MFLQNLRARLGARFSGEGEAGFTLIELLVVMLIIGILAAIALPAFFNQREKAGDSNAKEEAHTAQVSIETYATENGGSYVGATVKKLHEIEPTIPFKEGTGGTEESVVSVSNATKEGYEVTVESSTGNKFTIKNNKGAMSYPCTTEGKGGCPTGGWGNS